MRRWLLGDSTWCPGGIRKRVLGARNKIVRPQGPNPNPTEKGQLLEKIAIGQKSEQQNNTRDVCVKVCDKLCFKEEYNAFVLNKSFGWKYTQSFR